MMAFIGITVGSTPQKRSQFQRIRPYYPQAVSAGGGAPVLIPIGVSVTTLRRIYDQLDGLVISGGGDVDPSFYGERRSPHVKQVDSARDEQELQLVKWAVEDNKPLLAICRGHQVLNVALGGSLIQDIKTTLDSAITHNYTTDVWFEKIAHTVELEADSTLFTALDIQSTALDVNSLHHQAIKTLGEGLRVVARSEDDVIEGVELPENRFTVGVQWHPEALTHKMRPMKELFRTLVTKAAEG